MNLPKLVRNFFGLSRSETNGFLVLIPVILFILFSEPLYRKWVTSRSINYPDEDHYLDSLIRTWEKNELTKKIADDQPVNLFPFNPNTASLDELISLGFSRSIATRIINYRNSGGIFKVRKDLLKIYGLDSSSYQRLIPYIELPDSFVNTDLHTKENTITPKLKALAPFDINIADSAQLKRIHGIGDKLSVRIINYRKSLGGFVALNQLKEVFGLDSTVVNQLFQNCFIDKGFKPVALNLNVVTEEELDKHPYINRKEAKAIIAYRFQHGNFTAVGDLRKIHLIEEKTLNRILPYVTVD
jgi:competence ComEA-like helix-hairpin-helix protein